MAVVWWKADYIGGDVEGSNCIQSLSNYSQDRIASGQVDASHMSTPGSRESFLVGSELISLSSRARHRSFDRSMSLVHQWRISQFGYNSGPSHFLRSSNMIVMAYSLGGDSP